MLCVVVTKRTVIVSSYYEYSLAIDSMTQTEVTCNFRIRLVSCMSCLERSLLKPVLT